VAHLGLLCHPMGTRARSIFEHFNIADLCIPDRPMAQLYIVDAFSSLVVDVSVPQTDIAPICNGLPLPTCQFRVRRSMLYVLDVDLSSTL